jgi:KDO2-lipid IV(A) lauroyltransferase
MRRSMEVPTVFQRQVRQIVRLLRNNQVIGTLPDQDVDKLAGVFLPFFGREAYTPTGPATLAVTTRAPMLPVFIHRLGPARHALAIHPPIPDPGGDRDERVLAMTEGWTRVFERVIARWPTQWAWLHRRWDTTPEILERRRARRARKEARRTRESSRSNSRR